MAVRSRTFFKSKEERAILKYIEGGDPNKLNTLCSSDEDGFESVIESATNRNVVGKLLPYLDMAYSDEEYERKAKKHFQIVAWIISYNSALPVKQELVTTMVDELLNGILQTKSATSITFKILKTLYPEVIQNRKESAVKNLLEWMREVETESYDDMSSFSYRLLKDGFVKPLKVDVEKLCPEVIKFLAKILEKCENSFERFHFVMHRCLHAYPKDKLPELFVEIMSIFKFSTSPSGIIYPNAAECLKTFCKAGGFSALKTYDTKKPDDKGKRDSFVKLIEKLAFTECDDGYNPHLLILESLNDLGIRNVKADILPYYLEEWLNDRTDDNTKVLTTLLKNCDQEFMKSFVKVIQTVAVKVYDEIDIGRGDFPSEEVINLIHSSQSNSRFLIDHIMDTLKHSENSFLASPYSSLLVSLLEHLLTDKRDVSVSDYDSLLDKIYEDLLVNTVIMRDQHDEMAESNLLLYRNALIKAFGRLAKTRNLITNHRIVWLLNKYDKGVDNDEQKLRKTHLAYSCLREIMADEMSIHPNVWEGSLKLLRRNEPRRHEVADLLNSYLAAKKSEDTNLYKSWMQSNGTVEYKFVALLLQNLAKWAQDLDIDNENDTFERKQIFTDVHYIYSLLLGIANRYNSAGVMLAFPLIFHFQKINELEFREKNRSNILDLSASKYPEMVDKIGCQCRITQGKRLFGALVARWLYFVAYHFKLTELKEYMRAVAKPKSSPMMRQGISSEEKKDITLEMLKPKSLPEDWVLADETDDLPPNDKSRPVKITPFVRRRDVIETIEKELFPKEDDDYSDEDSSDSEREDNPDSDSEDEEDRLGHPHVRGDKIVKLLLLEWKTSD